MAKYNKFEDLPVWENGMALAISVHELFLNKVELQKEFDLKRQMFRAALSISNNIAEGFEYNNKKQFIRYLKYAKASAGEVRNMFLFLERTKLLSIEESKLKIQECVSIGNQIQGFIKYLKRLD